MPEAQVDWSAWVGREAGSADRLDPALAWRWLATFDLEAPHDDVMPQGVHLALCTPEATTAQLGPDGHPRRDTGGSGFLPPVPLPRRMWAASAMQFHAPLRIGADIERTSRIVSVEAKSGRRGDMIFVEIDHETRADGELAVSERQTVVYLEALAPDAPLSPPEAGDGTFDPSAWDAHRELRPDPRLLFRYSALTFNTHRIHYDAEYARDEERYRGLVVHGPLMASLLLQLAAKKLGGNALEKFAFRALSPAIADEVLHLVMRRSEQGYELGAFARDGRQVVTASAA